MSRNELRQALLYECRQILRRVARRRCDRSVTADDAQHVITSMGYQASDLGPAAGSLFRGGEWEFTGNWKKSKRPTNHSSDLRVWRLRTT